MVGSVEHCAPTCHDCPALHGGYPDTPGLKTQKECRLGNGWFARSSDAAFDHRFWEFQIYPDQIRFSRASAAADLINGMGSAHPRYNEQVGIRGQIHLNPAGYLKNRSKKLSWKLNTHYCGASVLFGHLRVLLPPLAAACRWQNVPLVRAVPPLFLPDRYMACQSA